MVHDPGVTNVCKFTNADEMRNLRLKGTGAPVVREDEGDPALLDQQDVEMPVGCVVNPRLSNVLACATQN